MTETISPMPEQIDAQQFAQQLVEKARADGVDLYEQVELVEEAMAQ